MNFAFCREGSTEGWEPKRRDGHRDVQLPRSETNVSRLSRRKSLDDRLMRDIFWNRGVRGARRHIFNGDLRS